MIAHDLQAIADQIGARAYSGKDIGPEMAAHLAIVLLDLARQAEMLERLPVVLAEADIVELRP